jgi:hypothetical protein
MRDHDTLYSAIPIDLGAQSNPIGATEPMSIEEPLADHNGSARVLPDLDPSLTVTSPADSDPRLTV